MGLLYCSLVPAIVPASPFHKRFVPRFGNKMLRLTLLVAAILPYVAGFQATVSPLRAHALKRSITSGADRSTVGRLSMQAEVDRRGFFSAAAGILALPVLLRPNSAQAVEDTAAAVTAGIATINKGGSTGPLPIEDVILAVIDDGSKEMKAALAGAKKSGAKVVQIKYSKNGGKKVQQDYMDNECYAAIVPNPKILTEVMADEGLVCKYCGYTGESPPKWFIVIDNQGQSRNEIMDTAGLTGQECGKGGCIQLGLAIPVYTLQGLDKITIDPKQGYFAVGDEKKD